MATKRCNRFPRSAVLLCLALAPAGAALAADAKCGEARDVKARALDEPTWQRLNRVYEMVAGEQYTGAREELLNLQNRSHDDYLQAIVWQALAQVQWSLEDFEAALTSFEKAVELDVLPDDTHFSLMRQVAQLYYMKERYRDALDRLDLFFCKAPKEKIRPDAWVLKASIHAQTRDWKQAVAAIDTAIGSSDDPEENWFQLKLAANFELEDFPAAAATLEEMIRRWPDMREYWVQLSNVWFRLDQDDKALSVLALAYRKKLLTEQSDYVYLSNLYSFRDVPLKAAEVMQEGLEAGVIENNEKHWTMTADAWYAAEEPERALAGYEKAGQAAETGEADLRRGYILIDLEHWAPACSALRQALDKGGFSERKIGEAHLMVGMCEFNQGHWDQASAAWGRAGRYSQARKAAEQWMNHMREERARKGA